MFTGPGGAYAPSPEADWHLLAGDESALPAIGAAVDALAPESDRPCLHRGGPAADVQDLGAPAGLQLHWLFRHGAPAGTTTLLRQAAALDGTGPRAASRPSSTGSGKWSSYCGDVLFVEHGLDRRQVSLSGYWAFGRAEDAFQAEKRTEIGQIIPAGYPVRHWGAPAVSASPPLRGPRAPL